MRTIRNLLRWLIGLPPITPAPRGQLSRKDVRRVLAALEARRTGKNAEPDEDKVVEVLKNLDKSAAQVVAGRRRVKGAITARHREDRKLWYAENAVITGEDANDLFKR